MTSLEWVQVGERRWKLREPPRATPDNRSSLPAPRVVTDHIEIKSMVDGKIYTSKSALRRSYRQNGYIEVGNEPLNPPSKPAPDHKGVEAAVGKALSRVGLSD